MTVAIGYMAEVFLKKPRWYYSGWGVTLLALGVLALAVIFLLVFLTVKYWWQIKNGQGEALRRDLFKQGTSTKDAYNEDLILAKRKELETAGSPTLGNPEAKVNIVEFIDFKCPNSQTSASVIKQISQKYGYKTKIIIRYFPAESVYPGGSKLAELAFCAAEQGRFWEMHDILFDRQEELSSDLTQEEKNDLANVAGVNLPKLETCLSSGRAKIGVNSDYAIGFKYEVRGTPTFFVNGEQVAGTVPWEVWEGYLKNFLKNLYVFKKKISY